MESNDTPLEMKEHRKHSHIYIDTHSTRSLRLQLSCVGVCMFVAFLRVLSGFLAHCKNKHGRLIG